MAVSSGPSDHTSSAGTTRLGSSTAWRANSMRQLSSAAGGRASPFSEGGTIRKQVRTVSASALLVACHTTSRLASCSQSRSSLSRNTPSGDPSARTQALTTFSPAAPPPRRPSVDGTNVIGSRARASVTLHISERRTSSLRVVPFSPISPIRLAPFDPGAPSARTAMKEAGAAHTNASIRPRSCPSMSGRQHARQSSATNSRCGSRRPRARSSTTISTARAAKRISGASTTAAPPATPSPLRD